MLLWSLCALASLCAAQPRFEVRMLQEAGPKEMRVTLLARGTEAFGLGDGVFALAYDSLRYHRAELLRCPLFGAAPYRTVELHTAGDTLSVGVFYDYRSQPGRGGRVGTEWTEVATRFALKTKQAPPMRLLPDVCGILRDDGVELFLRRE
ncbi:MAG: hypothetical protein IPP94_12460 [Ignavibacteria bacterium]|nr:hypothetical protein [Ignavibacteria bacterium]